MPNLLPTYGVPVAIFPADAALDLEIQRADDSGGLPNLSTLVTVATVPGTTSVYVDELPNDAAVRHYRARHVFAGDDPSPWTCFKSSVPVLLASSYEAPAAVAAIVQEQPVETATVGTLTLAVTDPQCRTTKIEFRSQSGGAAWGAWAEDTTAPYVATVTLVEKQVAKIAYRVTGYDALGRARVLAEQVVPFTAGAIPDAPNVSAEIDSSGNLIIECSGDSDTSYVRIAYATFGTPTDAAIRSGIVASGRVTRTTIVTALPANTTAVVGVFAYSSAGIESARSLATTSKASGGSDVAVRESPSENGSTGTLSLTLTDPTGRVTMVEGRKKSGPAGWTPYAVLAGPSYSQSVALVEKHVSLIQYRVSGALQSGGGGVLAESVVPFSLGSIPAPPSFEVECSTIGATSLRILGDSDSRSYRIASSIAAMPSDGAALAGTLYDTGGRNVAIASLVTLALGQTLYVKAIAYPGSGAQGTPSVAGATTFTRQSVAATKTVRLMAAEVTATRSSMGYNAAGAAGYVQRENPGPGGTSWSGVFLRLPAKLPSGVTLTGAVVRFYLDPSASGAAFTATFQRGETGVLLGQVTGTTLVGWQTLPLALGEVVSGEEYYVILTLTPRSSSSTHDADVRFQYVDLTYYSPTEANTL